VSIRPVQSQSRRGAFAVLLAAASLLSGALALAPSPAMAETAEGNNCANLEWQWEQIACEEGDGMGGGGSSDAAANTGQDSRPELGPKWFVDSYFDHTFDEPVGAFRRIFKDSPLDRLSTAYMACHMVWAHARRANHTHPHRWLTLHKEDPNDEWNQWEYSQIWDEYHCGQVFDPVGLP